MKKLDLEIVFRISIIFFVTLFFYACSSDDEAIAPIEPDEPTIVLPPITLDCNDFDKDVVLKNDPDRPVDYIVDCVIEIYATKLTIEPGTVIEFTEAGRIAIHRYYDDHSGAIVAKGTVEKPVIFRGTKAEKGHWRGLFIGTENNTNELDHVIIRDAGKESYTYGGQAGLVLGNAGYGYGKVKITNSQFLNNRKYGLEVTQHQNVTEDYLIVKNNIFEDNEAPIYAAIYNLHLLDPSNDFTGNDRDEIDVEGSANSTYYTYVDGTWHNHEIPYVFSSSVYIRSKITIAPGTVLKMPSTARIKIEAIYPLVGGLMAKGTAEKPIVFTGIESIPNFWNGIDFNSAYPGNEISHALIEYTGVVGEPQHIVLSSGDPTNYAKLNNIEFRHSNHGECAILRKYNSIWDSYADVDLGTIIVEDGHEIYCERDNS